MTSPSEPVHTVDDIIGNLRSEVKWCIDPQRLSGVYVDRERAARAEQQAKSALLKLLLDLPEMNDHRPTGYEMQAMHLPHDVETDSWAEGHNEAVEDICAALKQLFGAEEEKK